MCAFRTVYKKIQVLKLSAGSLKSGVFHVLMEAKQQMGHPDVQLGLSAHYGLVSDAGGGMAERGHLLTCLLFQSAKK